MKVHIFDFYGQAIQAIHTNFWLATHCSYSYSLYLSQSRSRAVWKNHKGVILRLREHYNYVYENIIIIDRIRRMGECNVFSLSTRGGGTPARSDGGGEYPSQVQQGGTPARSAYPSQVRTGVPQQGYSGTPSPGTGQHMEYLISGGRYASCVHAEGLFCYS